MKPVQTTLGIKGPLGNSQPAHARRSLRCRLVGDRPTLLIKKSVKRLCLKVQPVSVPLGCGARHTAPGVVFRRVHRLGAGIEARSRRQG